jgi:hypothetical protein
MFCISLLLFAAASFAALFFMYLRAGDNRDG